MKELVSESLTTLSRLFIKKLHIPYFWFAILFLLVFFVIFIIIFYIFAFIHECNHYRTAKHYYKKLNNSNAPFECKIIFTKRRYMYFDGFTQSNYFDYLNEHKDVYPKIIRRITLSGFLHSLLIVIFLTISSAFISCRISSHFVFLCIIFVLNIPPICILFFKNHSDTCDFTIVKNPSKFAYKPRVRQEIDENSVCKYYNCEDNTELNVKGTPINNTLEIWFVLGETKKPKKDKRNKRDKRDGG